MANGWIGVDLDGTLAYYDGWKGETVIGDPIPAMVARVREKLAQGIEIRIFTARAFHPSAHPAIAEWTERHIGIPLKVTATKDYACIEIWDDRARRVIPNMGKFCCDN